MQNSKYIIDDNINIPDYMQKMNLEELEKYILKLETEEQNKKKLKKMMA